jgi:hypothetical protein
MKNSALFFDLTFLHTDLFLAFTTLGVCILASFLIVKMTRNRNKQQYFDPVESENNSVEKNSDGKQTKDWENIQQLIENILDFAKYSNNLQKQPILRNLLKSKLLDHFKPQVINSICDLKTIAREYYRIAGEIDKETQCEKVKIEELKRSNGIEMLRIIRNKKLVYRLKTKAHESIEQAHEIARVFSACFQDKDAYLDYSTVSQQEDDFKICSTSLCSDLKKELANNIDLSGNPVIRKLSDYSFDDLTSNLIKNFKLYEALLTWEKIGKMNIRDILKNVKADLDWAENYDRTLDCKSESFVSKMNNLIGNSELNQKNNQVVISFYSKYHLIIYRLLEKVNNSLI